MPAVPFPVSSSPGPRPQESAGRLKNGFAVKTEQGARSPFKWQRSPGLISLVTASGYSGYRGFIEINGSVIAVIGRRAFGITRAGSVYTASDLGEVPGDALVTIAKNNRTPTPDIVCVVPGEGAFNLFTGSAPTVFADADVGSPNSVSVLDGYLLFTYGDGTIRASDLNAVTVSSSSYTQAQKRSDGLLRGVTHRGEFFAFGQSSCEVYVDRGLTPFPLEFSVMIPRGLAGRYAVAGWEEGWSNELIWAADDNVVYRLNGYTPEPISNPDVADAIEAMTDKSVLEASVYMSGKNAFWVLTNPAVWSWEYNVTTGTWNERVSYQQGGWRISRTVKAFDQWIAGERLTGTLYAISQTAKKEGTHPLVWEVESGAVASPPNRIAASRLDVDMTAAVGREAGDDPIETNPHVEIQWSKDGGYTWGLPVQREIGGEGESKKSVSVSSLGLAGPKGFKVRLRVSDPVPATLFGATISNPQVRAPG